MKGGGVPLLVLLVLPDARVDGARRGESVDPVVLVDGVTVLELGGPDEPVWGFQREVGVLEPELEDRGSDDEKVVAIEAPAALADEVPELDGDVLVRAETPLWSLGTQVVAEGVAASDEGVRPACGLALVWFETDAVEADAGLAFEVEVVEGRAITRKSRSPERDVGAHRISARMVAGQPLSTSRVPPECVPRRYMIYTMLLMVVGGGVFMRTAIRSPDTIS